MDPLPNGFGFNHQCLDWLIKLDIYTWDDFKIQAFFLDVKSLMTNLTVGAKIKHWMDRQTAGARLNSKLAMRRIDAKFKCNVHFL